MNTREQNREQFPRQYATTAERRSQKFRAAYMGPRGPVFPLGLPGDQAVFDPSKHRHLLMGRHPGESVRAYHARRIVKGR
jgi:hypothetical protein